jgi:hypothetical protein
MDMIVLLLAAMGIITIWLVVLTALIAKEKQFLRELSKGTTKKDLTSILRQLNTSIKLASTKLENTSDRIDKLEIATKLHFQKIGFVRFNPFADTGGDQSFSLCLLDQNNNGIVITSLHSRNTTRLYAKEMQSAHISQNDYSEEEWKSYQAAKNYK